MLPEEEEDATPVRTSTTSREEVRSKSSAAQVGQHRVPAANQGTASWVLANGTAGKFPRPPNFFKAVKLIKVIFRRQTCTALCLHI